MLAARGRGSLQPGVFESEPGFFPTEPTGRRRVAYYAHSRNARGVRQNLVEHLRKVAELAAEFAGDLGAAEAGRLLGLWHDPDRSHPP